jgi:DNA modification methylase
MRRPKIEQEFEPESFEVRDFEDGLVICADVFGQFISAKDGTYLFPLIICDPPYGEITNEAWDIAAYNKWMLRCVEQSAEDATIAMWGGVGKYKHRPLLEFAASVERDFPGWEIMNWITWAKKRAYGVQDNYLFTREECLILTRGKPTFNIPLLPTIRPYAGYNAKYPAKSEFYRRTNVWSDVTEILRGKVHPTQKPDALYEILIATHSNEGDTIYDPGAGSCTTMRAARKLKRRFVCVESNRRYLVDAGIFT